MYQCPKCPALSADPSNLKRHIASVHERQVFCCAQCDFKDPKKKRLDEHIELEHLEIMDEEALKENEVATDGGGVDENAIGNRGGIDTSQELQFTFQCGECKCEKGTLEDLQKHQNEKHCNGLGQGLGIKRFPSVMKENFSCNLCGAKFKKGTLLNQHKLTVHKLSMKTDFGCDQCGIKCANLPGLKAHQRGHIEKRFLCGSCNKSFLVLTHLKEHVERGSCLLENRKCKLCHKVYSDRIRLELHMRVHNNLKPFPCTVCEKAFTQKRSLKEHLLTHDTIRHYECRHCEKKFVQKNHLKYHLASQHAETTASEVRIKQKVSEYALVGSAPVRCLQQTLPLPVPAAKACGGSWVKVGRKTTAVQASKTRWMKWKTLTFTSSGAACHGSPPQPFFRNTHQNARPKLKLDRIQERRRSGLKKKTSSN